MSGLRMNRELVLEERVALPDGAGGATAQWSALGTLWAHIAVSSGSDTGALGVNRSAVQSRITLRAAPHGSSLRPRPDQRFREGTRVYRIRAVAEDDPVGRYLTCYAIEEVAA